MKFSTQEEYGIRLMLALAQEGRSMTIPELSKREGLSEPHVAKLLMILRKQGFINSTRGFAGGYTLAAAPEEVVVGDLLAALGGRLYEDDFCERHRGQVSVCTHDYSCSLRSLWHGIQVAVDQVVNNITLADLLKAEASGAAEVQFFDEPPAFVRRRELLGAGDGK